MPSTEIRYDGQRRRTGCGGICGQQRSRTAQQPVGSIGADAMWNPLVAREAEIVRVLIVAAILWMSEHATPRDQLVIRILME